LVCFVNIIDSTDLQFVVVQAPIRQIFSVFQDYSEPQRTPWGSTPHNLLFMKQDPNGCLASIGRVRAQRKMSDLKPISTQQGLQFTILSMLLKRTKKA
jgi:hypothetical protein